MTSSKSLSNGPTRCATSAALAIISMAVSLGLATQGAEALTAYQAQVVCPIDGKQFSATMVGSSYQQGTRLDSKPLGSLVAPYPFPVCPENGFVMYQNEFAAGELAAVKAIVLTDEYRQLRGEHTNYYMVAYVKERLEANNFDLGNLYLQASWEAEATKSALVRQYRTLAIERFDAFVKNDASHSEDWWVASIIAAELDRLLGQFDAVRNRIKSLPPAPNKYFALAIEQIRSHALDRNAKPEEMIFRVSDDKTVGSGVMR
jgi:hypothetical protein